MKKYFKRGFLILLAIFIIMQFIRPSKNINTQPQANNFSKLAPINDTVNSILKKACYDCHSNNTMYPWYANIMPVGYFLANHVNEGKRELNFDEIASYKAKKALHKIDEIVKEVEEGEMPLSSYTIIHNEAKLTENEKNILIQWQKIVK